ncbi:MAG: hypothetical protein A2W18_07520 [Candidatus Muproteobacteria bacterium RBG_16_60_9]|uniref:Uncharacterized protein n=1 Tax=Candidatus Muproteobacteria bacterium RBG_16_60_9 TaxID=1817755 RepID=A0A1F6V2B9_9PROT|nr:MAG: hypothetical protein A2W18_07520 [Candidatus Muproteobacteria bacterium RBG_16_60_9]
MKLWHWIVIGVVIAGLFSGPGALEAGAAAQPPIEWSDIPFVFVGGVLGMIFVIGIQLLRREPKPSKWALWLLGPASLYFVVSGLSAVVLASSRCGVAPHAVLFFAVGAGTLIGVGVSWLLYRWRFKNAL